MPQATATNPAENKTCSTCQQFNNYNEPHGKGWCELFDQPARTFHHQTLDCILNLNDAPEFTEAFSTKEVIDPADLPHSEYGRGDIVKVIDPEEDHSEWATFQIVEAHYNSERYRTTESYLQESDWYFTLSNLDNSILFLAAENEICKANMSWNIDTSEDIF